MKEILLAIKAGLPALVTAQKSIAVIPDENILPEEAPLPFTGLKDGDKTCDGALDPLTKYYVDVICYVEIAKPEASIIGDTATSKVGILDYCEQVKAGLLALGTLGIAGIISMNVDTTERASETGELDEGFIQKKKLRVWYKKNKRG